ncbi:hypothetical protein BGW38_004945 [Lunasporangiospora selenospora]|uniref:Annexin n=1 Tax=Lunasporangiospora selenospora TaxID=979761 RepID=A0A9P6KBP1_9FUNG|nr:hypothetical protein BGW38_004945 [Lunasporangiospora selenospora]
MVSTIPPEVAFDLQNIHNALSFAVPDVEALVNTIGRREYQQLLVVARQYKLGYGVDLPVELDKRIIGSVGSLLAGATMHKVLAEVQYLHKAGKSNRKYEALRKKDTAIEVICQIVLGRTPTDLRELHEAYEAVYKSNIKDHILSFCKDDMLKEFFADILNQKDKEDVPLEFSELESAIEKLHVLLQAHDLPGLLKYVASFTTSQLNSLVRGYNSHYRDAHVVTVVNKTIAHKHKSEHVEVLLFAVMQAADPARHISLLFEESMAGLGTNEDQLSRLVVLHRGRLIEKIKVSYHTDYDRTLADRVRGDTSGLYSNLVCHLINQTI